MLRRSLLAALVLWGFKPGPLFISENPNLFWGLVASMYIGNLMLLILNLPLVPLFAQVLRVGLFIKPLQALLLLSTELACSFEPLKRGLSLIPNAPHLVTDSRLFDEVHHRLEQIVGEPHLLVERIHCLDLLGTIKAQIAKVLAH